jgi:hypothetical protein
MDRVFLGDVFKGLPEALREQMLKQLEGILKEVDKTYRPYQALSDMQATVLCAKIFSVFDLARKFRKELQEPEE